MSYQTIIVEIEEHVALVRLNRPEALNALNAQLLAEVGQALSAFDADPKVRAVVLTGSEKAFAAGADIREMAGKSFADMFVEDVFTPESEVILRCRKPVIAAVSGYCLGGGAELAMMCDIVIAAEGAKFGQPEINLGIIPGLGGTQRLTRAVGKAKAMDMILTGRMIGAEEAERIGLVSRVVADEKALEEALEVAATIASKSKPASWMAKEAVNAAFETTLAQGIAFERRVFHAAFATADQKEGMDAFTAKREAGWQHR